MYVKVTASGPRRHIQLVESFRGENGRPRQRTVATLGRVDELTPKDVDALINGLLRATGRQPLAEQGDAAFAQALSCGDAWVLSQLWHRLGLREAIRPLVANRRVGFDVEAWLAGDGAQSAVRPGVQARRAALGTDHSGARRTD
jgi:hypothetical protein